MTVIYWYSALELAEKIAKGELKAVDVVEAFIERIEKVNPSINAVVVPMFDQALALAKEADKKQGRKEPLAPLHGGPNEAGTIFPPPLEMEVKRF